MSRPDKKFRALARRDLQPRFDRAEPGLSFDRRRQIAATPVGGVFSRAAPATKLSLVSEMEREGPEMDSGLCFPISAESPNRNDIANSNRASCDVAFKRR
ncbi:hypothetical protein LG047_02255 [Methylocystis sp. WRRC1]|uniref:hypothetical protein n=1 Tax=Methylocystis sp. WRRC1 TaxID=1732014 RepID=UPI001D13B2A6|nr:hypothetical protein [Methylocystis sp. WRRC1]MCC3244154.1 hypothetical protein [Methylocystis sp. WRRC1]